MSKSVNVHSASIVKLANNFKNDGNISYQNEYKTTKHVTETQFSMFFINITSLRNKSQLLLDEMGHFKEIDVVNIAEHWMKEEENVSLRNFEMVAKYCRKSKVGGGVCTFAKRESNYSELDFSHLCQQSVFEVCAVKICKVKDKILKAPIILVTIYRAPDGDFESFIAKLDELFTELNETRLKFFVTGDFNIHMHSDTCRKNNIFKNMIVSFGLKLLITDTFTHGQTLIDNCITNMEIEKCEAQTVKTTLTKHLGLQITAKFPQTEEDQTLFLRDYRKRNKRIFY